MCDVYELFKGVKWVFVDLDDTLWDFKENSNDTLKKIYNHFNILSSLYSDYNDYAKVYHSVNANLWTRYHHGEIEQEFLKLERFRELLSNKSYCNEDIDLLASQLNDWYLNELAKCNKIVDGAIELLEELSKRFLIGILSNGFIEVQYKKINSSGLNRFVQRMVVSDEIGIQKPDGRIFEYALSEVGAKSDEVILIGDNPDADIKGAYKSGWKTIFFNRNKKLLDDDVKCNLEIDSLSELAELLKANFKDC